MLRPLLVISIMLSLIYVGFLFLEVGRDVGAYFFFAQAFFAFFLMLPPKFSQIDAQPIQQPESNVVQMPKIPTSAKVGASAYAGYKLGKSDFTG